MRLSTNSHQKQTPRYQMAAKFLFMLLATATLIPLTSCDQKAGNDEKSTQVAPKAEDPFVLVPRLVRNEGSYELLTVIEGAEPNRRFVANLQIVTAQRENLSKLKEKASKTEEDKKNAEALEKKLQENANLMLKNYGYNITADYLFIPVKSSLVKVVEGKNELVRINESPNEYNKLRGLLAQYAKLKADGAQDSADGQEIAAKLMLDYNCDVKLTHSIDINKSALYRKVN